MTLVLPANEVSRVAAVRRIVRALARGKSLGLFQTDPVMGAPGEVGINQSAKIIVD